MVIWLFYKEAGVPFKDMGWVDTACQTHPPWFLYYWGKDFAVLNSQIQSSWLKKKLMMIGNAKPQIISEENPGPELLANFPNIWGEFLEPGITFMTSCAASPPTKALTGAKFPVAWKASSLMTSSFSCSCLSEGAACSFKSLTKARTSLASAWKGRERSQT